MGYPCQSLSALAARTKGTGKSRRKDEDEHDHDEPCKNCKKPGHSEEECYSKGGGKEGQGPRQKKKAKESEKAVVATNDEGDEIFAFTCMLDHIAIAEELEMTKSRLGMGCIDSKASKKYRPDRTKFTNHNSIQCQRTPVRALKSQPPYEVSNKGRTHLTGIQEIKAAAHIKTPSRNRMKSNRSDQGGEFLVNNSPQNGVSKRKMRTRGE